MPVHPSSYLERLAWSAAQKLPPDEDPNQDLLFDLAKGMSIEDLATTRTSGNRPMLLRRLVAQYDRLGIPSAYSTAEGIKILNRAFEIFDQRSST